MASLATTPNEDRSRFLTIRQFCREEKLPERLVRDATKRGEIALYQPPGAWPRIDRDEALDWFRRQRVEPPAHAREHVERVLAGWRSADGRGQ